MSVQSVIRQKLDAALSPASLTIIDDSRRHAGHAGARPEGETHFRIEIVSDAFTGRNAVERQRMVYALLADELAGPVHALSLTTRTSSEAAERAHSKS